MGVQKRYRQGQILKLLAAHAVASQDELRRHLGHIGMRVEKTADVEPALREAFRLKDRTVFLDFQTDPTENVWPMVQAGKGISEMLLGAEDL